MSTSTSFAVLGLGEAGSRYAGDLAACGAGVHAYDPAAVATPPGVDRAPSIAAAVGGADAVLCLAAAEHAVSIAREAAPHLRTDAVYADLNTASPQVKRDVAAALSGTGALPVDVAVLAPVPRDGLRTPLLACGPGTRHLGAALRPFEVPMDELDADVGDVGDAAARKLLRGVFMKGLAAVVLETLAAGRAAGCEDWLRGQVTAEFRAAGPGLVDRLVEGSRTHARRRVDEMAAARAFLRDMGTPARTTDAALDWLADLVAEAER